MPHQSILSCYFRGLWKTIYNLRGFHLNAIQGRSCEGMVGLHTSVPELFRRASHVTTSLVNWLFLKAVQLVRTAPTKNLRRRLVSKTSYAYDL